VTERVRVGTRRSPLARIQTDLVLSQLARVAPSWRFDAVPVDTSGDRDRSPGSSPDFTDTIDRALVEGMIDLAVHSAKDLPVELDSRLTLLASPRRADPRDCLVVGSSGRGRNLPRGAKVGSSSLRRRAQLLRWRPDLNVVEIRGNVGTRIGLVQSGAIDAAILAVAGVTRLGRSAEITRFLPVTAFLPAPAQGALAVVARSNDRVLNPIVSRLDHAATRACVNAERAFAAALGGDCQVPLGALAKGGGPSITVWGEVLAPNGRTALRGYRRGRMTDATRIGSTLGAELLDRGALDLITPARP
jgi:hydroxymethylbilane synthase